MVDTFFKRTTGIPDRDESLIVGVVKALVCVLAGVVSSIPPVLYKEGGALKLESVHTHLSVHRQLGIIDIVFTHISVFTNS